MKTKTEKNPRWQALAASVLATLASATLAQAQPGPGAAASKAEDEQGPPRIVATSPRIGETEVSPALKEITVTFDRDMERGMSWTGGGPDFPLSAPGQKAQCRNKRTCVLPVSLDRKSVV